MKLINTIPSRRLLDKDGKVMVIDITDSAVQRLKELSKLKRGGKGFDLRLAIEPGGCHGFQYKFEALPADIKPEPEDIVFERDGARVVVDEESLGLLAGAKVDYTRELIGKTFQVIQNPAADSGCGCGFSFNLGSSLGDKKKPSS